LDNLFILISDLFNSIDPSSEDSSDFEDFESVEIDLEDLLEPAIELFDKVDLVFDARICNHLDSDKVAIDAQIKQIGQVYKNIITTQNK
jgi:hypothetical protein